MGYTEFDVKKGSVLEIILRDKQKFVFYITRYDIFQKTIEKYKISLGEGKDKLLNVNIDIDERTRTVDLHCIGERSTHHKIENVSNITDTENCIVQAIDNWNSYSRD